MLVGWVTISEADSFLKNAWFADDWKYSGQYPITQGNAISYSGNAKKLNGANTVFTALRPKQSIRIDDFIARIVSIESDTELTLDRDVEVTTPSPIYLLTQSQYDLEYTQLVSKTKCLLHAYNRIVTSPFYIIRDVTQNIKYAQIVLALLFYRVNVTKTAKEDPHSKNINAGISAFSIGDMSYTYEKAQGGKANFFPDDVQDFLSDVRSNNRIFHLGRSGNPKTFSSIPIELYLTRFFTVPLIMDTEKDFSMNPL